MVNDLGGSGDVLAFTFKPGQPCVEAEKAFDSVMSGNPGIKVTKQEVPAPGWEQAGLTATNAWLQSHPKGSGDRHIGLEFSNSVDAFCVGPRPDIFTLCVGAPRRTLVVVRDASAEERIAVRTTVDLTVVHQPLAVPSAVVRDLLLHLRTSADHLSSGRQVG